MIDNTAECCQVHKMGKCDAVFTCCGKCPTFFGPAPTAARVLHLERDHCLNCGEVVERTDDGQWWHPQGESGYKQCHLRATPSSPYGGAM